MAYLIIYDSSIAESKVSALVCMQKYPTATLKDIVDLTEGNIDTYIATITLGDYDKILVCVETDDVLTQAQMVTLEALIDDTPLGDDAAAAGGASTITLAVGSSAVDDYYNGKTILIDVDAVGASEDQVRVITDYVGSTRVATVDSAWDTAITTDSNYVISENIYEFKRAIASVTGPKRAWNTLIEKNVPTLVAMMGGKLETHIFEKDAKTSSSMAAGTLSDTGEFTANAYNKNNGGDDYFVAIKASADGGVGQIRRITSNTTGVLTLDGDWNVTPAAASEYQICRGAKFILWDEYLPLSVETYLNFSGNTFPDDAYSKFQRCVDAHKGIPGGKVRLFEDMTYLEELAELGKVIYTAKAEGVVT